MRAERADLRTRGRLTAGRRPGLRALATPVLLTFTLALVAGCGGSSSPSSATSAPPVKTGHIGGSVTVAVAYPSPPAKLLAEFKQQTGITVNWVNVGWDDLQSKIVAASTAHS